MQAGYGKEEETCVFELTYNYGKDKYDNFKGEGYAQVALSSEVRSGSQCLTKSEHLLNIKQFSIGPHGVCSHGLRFCLSVKLWSSCLMQIMQVTLPCCVI